MCEQDSYATACTALSPDTGLCSGNASGACRGSFTRQLADLLAESLAYPVEELHQQLVLLHTYTVPFQRIRTLGYMLYRACTAVIQCCRRNGAVAPRQFRRANRRIRHWPSGFATLAKLQKQLFELESTAG